jgi:hypothetical protein
MIGALGAGKMMEATMPKRLTESAVQSQCRMSRPNRLR